jgi:hypothetical protein
VQTVRRSLAALLFFLLPQLTPAAILTHRWTFETDASDMIGGADGVLQGNACFTNGAVVLDGTNGGVQLPDDLFTNYNSISLEVWFVDENRNGARLYNFSGPDGRMECTVLGSFPPGFPSYPVGGTCFSTGGRSNIVHMPSAVPDITNHLVWTLDADSGLARAYLNAVLVSQKFNFTNTPARIGSTTNNWIGAAAACSNVFQGRILDFRTYSGTLTSLEVAQSAAAGPGNQGLNAGSLQGIRISMPSTVGPGASIPPLVLADFQNLTNVNISGQPELSLTTGNTNVILVTTATNVLRRYGPMKVEPLLTSTLRLNARSHGTATVTAVYQDITNQAVITVAPPDGFELAHRYTFREPCDAQVVHDTVGHDHGRIFGGCRFSGDGNLLLPGGTSGNPNSSFVALPRGLISCESEISIVAWVTWKGPTYSYWQRIFDFGDQVLHYPWTASTYLFLTPNSGRDSILRPYIVGASITTNSVTGEATPIGGSCALPLDVSSQIAVTYSFPRRVFCVYTNGLLAQRTTAVTIPLSAIDDVNCWLGRSAFDQDPCFYGSFDEFRIYRGLLSDADVAAEFAAGPDIITDDLRLRTSLSGTNLTITWGASAADYRLESRSQLQPAVWSEVTQPSHFDGSSYRVIVDLSNSERFFRLHKP